MFQEFMFGSGYDQLSEALRLAMLRSSLGAEGYHNCIDLCPAAICYEDTVTRLANRFQRRQSATYSRAQFNRRTQHVGKKCRQFVTEL